MSHPVFWVSQMAKSKTEKTQMIVCKSFLRWKREKETNNNKKKLQLAPMSMAFEYMF